jgi:hypothetical protein
MNARNAHRIQPRDSMYPPDAPPFNLPKVENDTGPCGCDDLTPALLCFIAGAVAFVVVLAVAGVLP